MYKKTKTPELPLNYLQKKKAGNSTSVNLNVEGKLRIAKQESQKLNDNKVINELNENVEMGSS